MGDGAMRCVHAVGIGLVTVIVPEASQEMLSAVFIPDVVVFVEGCELHVVQVCQTVTFKMGQSSVNDSDLSRTSLGRKERFNSVFL